MRLISRSHVIWALAVLAYCVSGWTVLSQPANHDVAWMIYSASRVLGGADLYVDLIEVNPPLVVFLSLPLLLLGQLIGLRGIVAYKLGVLILIPAAVLLAGYWLRLALPRRRHGVLPYLGLASVFGLIPIFHAPLAYEFGQRDHLALILALPYLLQAAVARRVAGAPAMAISTGIIAGIGISLKPYYLPIWLGVEFYLHLVRDRRSWLRPTHLALIGTGAAYLVSILLFTPEYLQVASWAASTYDDFYPAGPGTILVSFETALASVVVLAALLLPAEPALRPVRASLCIGLAGFWAAVLMQNKNWGYHWLPVYSLSIPLLTLVAVDLNRLMSAVKNRCKGMEAFVVSAVLASAVTTVILLEAPRTVARQWAQLSLPYFHLPEMMALVDRHAAGGSISALTPYLVVGFPLVNYTGVEWASRFNSLWMIPGLYPESTWPARSGPPYHPPAERSTLENYVLRSVAQDLSVKKPNLLIVDRFPPEPRLRGFDYLRYFSQDPIFKAEIKNYRLLARVGRFDVYERAQVPG